MHLMINCWGAKTGNHFFIDFEVLSDGLWSAK